MKLSIQKLNQLSTKEHNVVENRTLQYASQPTINFTSWSFIVVVVVVVVGKWAVALLLYK